MTMTSTGMIEALQAKGKKILRFEFLLLNGK